MTFPKNSGDRLESNLFVWVTHGSLTAAKNHRGRWLEILGGGNSNIFSFLPRKLGKMNPFWRAYFSKGLVQPPTQKLMARPSTCKPTMWNKALRALIVQMSVRETRLKPSRETPRGRDDGEVAQRFKWWLGMGKESVSRCVKGGTRGWFLGDLGVVDVFFCQPDNLGVNDSQFDLVDTFPKCVFLASRFLDSKWGVANFPWLWFSGWFSNGYHRMKWIQLPNLNVEAPNLL